MTEKQAEHFLTAQRIASVALGIKPAETRASLTIREVRAIMRNENIGLRAAGKLFTIRWPRFTVKLLDDIGSWPSSEPELWAVQEAFR